MSKKPLEAIASLRRARRPSLSARLETIRYLNEINSSSGLRRTNPIQHIADALVAAGYTTLDKQARALGIHRAGLDYRKEETQARPFKFQNNHAHSR